MAGAQSGLQVYSKVLSGSSGRRAVLLLNRTTAAANITARWSDLGLTGAAGARNLWTATDLGSFATGYTTSGPAGQAVLLTVTGTDGAQPTAKRIVGAQSGRCVDVTGAATTNGTQTQLRDCSGQPNQSWTYTSAKQLQVYGDTCLDANGQGTTNGTAVIIWACNGQPNQRWNLQ